MNCPRCKAPMRDGARFCGNCGHSLSQPLPPLPATPPSGAMPTPVSSPADATPPASPPLGESPSPQLHEDRPGCSPLSWLSSLFGAESDTAQIQASSSSGPLQTGSTRVLRPDEDIISVFSDRYVTIRYELRPTFGFYEVYDLSCNHCGTKNKPAHGRQCSQCQQPLAQALLHVSRLERKPQLESKDIQRLSQEHPHILDHVSFWQEGDRFVVLLAYPPGWEPLFRVVPVQDATQVARWGIQLGEALAYLHGRRVVHYALDTESLEGLVVQGGQIKFSDLTKTWALQFLPEEQILNLLHRDIMFVAKAVHYMATGQMRPLAEESAFHGIFVRAFNNQYASMGHLLDDLKVIQGGRQVGVQVTFSVGQANHAGKVRPANEDAAFVLPMMRLHESQSMATALCLVADGMGGQDAGERASKIAYKMIAAEITNQLILPRLEGEITRKLYSSSGEVLKEAIQKANQRVYEVARQQGSNMGTTVTAVLLEGPRAYVANVGDSRTYRLRNGVLETLTEDHSLVGSLLKAGQISPEEVYTHPQRSQIYRSLGAKPTVEVDLETVDLKKGDQLLLCSDGLWEMVRDPQIREILLQAPTPQAACDMLVRAAYDAGGEDNITVVVVHVQ